MNRGNEEKRAYKRFEADENCWALLDNDDKLAIKNISIFGACLTVPRPYDKEKSCTITICSDISGNITLSGSVMWSYPMGPEQSPKKSGESLGLYYETGIKFIGMNDTQKKALQMFIDSLD